MMKQQNYQKAQIAFVEASPEGSLLAASEIQSFSVYSLGQDLAPTVDYEDDVFNLNWD